MSDVESLFARNGVQLRLMHRDAADAEPEVVPYSVGITGSRSYPNLEFVASYVRHLAANAPNRGIRIVTGNEPGDRGKAIGVDETVVNAAKDSGIAYLIIQPEDRSRKGTYLARNTEIVKKSDAVVGFWDGESRGTADTLVKAIKARKLKAVYGPDGVKRDLARVESRLKSKGFSF